METPRRICTICNKSFANGKAMGGHMRSHFAKLPIPPKIINPPNSTGSTPSPKSPSPSPSHRIDPSPTLCIRKNNVIRLSRSVNRGFSSVTESPENTTTKKAKWIGSSSSPPPHSVSSVSEAFSGMEDAAQSLLTLSRSEGRRDEPTCEEHDESDESDSVTRDRVSAQSSKHGYRCETWGKLFESYQALGGKKASHTKIDEDGDNTKIEDKEGDDNVVDRDTNIFDQKNFECPVCYEAFDSGKALGGHKKVHLRKAPKWKRKFLDLNLPPPLDYHYESPLKLHR